MNRLKYTALIILCCFFLPVCNSLASGTGNINGGGGGLNQGKDGYSWPGVGYDGVRVTVVDAESGQRISQPVDYTNVNVAALSANIIHFGKGSKVDYRSGATLLPQVSNYQYNHPQNPLPQIISGSSKKADIATIRNYFCSEAAAMMVANDTGIAFDDIESGKYKLIIEPLIYLLYQNQHFALTTTEAGLYNRLTGGDIAKHFPTVVMKNHALALFLERDDLGFPAWTGPTGSARSTDEMIHILGIGIISYKGQPPTEVNFDKEYRVDTDVIIAVELSTSSKKHPGKAAYARFTINGKTYSHNNIYLPDNGSQLAWVKWRTPKEPGQVTINITSNCKTSVGKIVANIVDLNENPPPDPQANDRNDRFRIPAKPSYQDVTNLTWGEWDCWWQPDWVWHSGDEDESGYWCDHGWWEYEWLSYSASLTASLETHPDEKSPTAASNMMKSGYGLTAAAKAQVHAFAPSGHITGVQNVVAYFPEFDYQMYWRLLKRLNSGYLSTFEFQENPYSTYRRPTHFSPVWFPDGRYSTYATYLDAWTPAGMLQIHRTSDITIKQSLFDDWHVKPK
ncbi:MAG: hypothetical protein ACRDBO_04090 [Lachnospiraceae bacterium]